MEKFLAEADYTLPAADEDEDEGLDGDGVLPDYAASRHAAPDAER
jgi:hypothetical protein